jgi:methyl acetate hydrolase
MQNNAQIDQALRQMTDAREIPGVVAIAATGKEVIYQGAFGRRDLSKDDAMTADSVFWIASMTKARSGLMAFRFSPDIAACRRSTSDS